MITRIRTVKPELAKHALLRRLARITGWHMRYLYMGLWWLTDRAGRFEWKPEELRHDIDPDFAGDFEHVLNVLANAGFVVKYRVRARVYGWVARFLDHQNINGREQPSRLPTPPEGVTAWIEELHLRADFNALTLDQLVRPPDTLEIAVTAEQIEQLRGRPRDTLRTERNGTEQNDTLQTPRGRAAGASGVVDDVASSNGNGRRSSTRRASGRSRARSSRRAADDVERASEQSTGESVGHPADARADAVTTSATPLADPLTPSDVRACVSPPADASTSSSATTGDGIPTRYTSVEIVDGGRRNVPALPPVRGVRRAENVRDALVRTFAEISEGTRTAMRSEQLRTLQARMVWLYWTAKFDHEHAIYDPKREARIVARLRENDGNVSELLYALDGAFHDDYVMGRGQYAGQGRRDQIHFILRDREQIERYAAQRKRYRQQLPHKALDKLEAALRGEPIAGDVVAVHPTHAEDHHA
jgi:hypothetical protein